MDHRFTVVARPQERAAARRIQPLVAISRVPVRAKRGDVEIDLPRRVGSIDKNERAALARERGNLRDWPDQAGRRGNMVDDDQPRARVDGACERLDQLLPTLNGKADERRGSLRAATFADITHCLAHRAVALTVQQDLVTGLEIERAQDSVDRRTRAFYENEICRIGANKPCKLIGGAAQSF